MEHDVESILTLAANVRPERFHGEAGEVRQGTKHFVPGAAVFYAGAFWGMGAEEVHVVGQSRTKAMITITIRAEWLTNWRPKVVFKPSVVKRLAGTLHETRSAQEWQELADMFNQRSVLHAYERTVVEATECWRSWPGAGPLPHGALKAAVLYDDGPGSAIGAAFSYADGTDVSWIGEVGDEYRTKRARAMLLSKLALAEGR